MSRINTKVDYLILINVVLSFAYPVKLLLLNLYPTVPELRLIALLLFALVFLHEVTLLPEISRKVERDSAKSRLKRRVLYSTIQTLVLAILYIVF